MTNTVRIQKLFETIDVKYKENTNLTEEVIFLRKRFKEHPRMYKSYFDAKLHGTEIRFDNEEVDDVDKQAFELLEDICETYGVNNIVFETIRKSLVDIEYTKDFIVKEYKEANGVPPAFNKLLVANPIITDKNEWLARSIQEAITKWMGGDNSDSDRYNHFNLRRFVKYASRVYKREYRKMKWRIITLNNGSSTRIEDIINIMDILGILYLPSDINIDDYEQLCTYLHVANYRHELGLEYIEYESGGVGGRHEVNPDDQGKSRELYSMDPWVQVISKAFHSLLSSVAKKLPGNGTFDQHRWIRTCLEEGWNHNSYILSTDMSKYSDTLKFSFILSVLNDIGVDPKYNDVLEKLYHQPVVDEYLHTIWSGSEASYQGQYGDFPMITICNLYLQCMCYDSVNVEMYWPNRAERRNGDYSKMWNGAVGDDTIMRLPEKIDSFYDNVVFIYGMAGVNINRSKTHVLNKGHGFVDYLKRVITSKGLVPYFRFNAFEEDNFTEIVIELYRAYRDGMYLNPVKWRKLVRGIFSGDESDKAEWIIDLNRINGGVNERKITLKDLKLFRHKINLLKDEYTLNKEDEIRKFLEIFKVSLEEDGLSLKDTALLGYWESSQQYVEDTLNSLEDNSDEEGMFDSPKATMFPDDIDSQIEQSLLNQLVIGWDCGEVHNLERMIGMTYSEVMSCKETADIAKFLEDFDNMEAYRYMTLNEKRFKKHTVYEDLYNVDVKKLKFVDYLCLPVNSESGTDYSSRVIRSRVQLLRNIIARDPNCRIESERVFYVDRDYGVYNEGSTYEVFRLYSLCRPTDRSRKLISYSTFARILLRYESGLDLDAIKRLHSMFNANLGYLDYSEQIANRV